MKTFIAVNIQVEGIHRWSKAKEVEPKVGFLEHPHRHIFHIKVLKEVFHEDRDIEIILFGRKVKNKLYNDYFDLNIQMCDFRGRSCETLATEILTFFGCYQVQVLEDGENGAVVSI